MQARYTLLLLLAAAAAGPAAAAAVSAATPGASPSQQVALQVSHAWIRAVPGADNAALYLELRNPGSTPVTITGASSSAATGVMIHQSQVSSGRSTMRMLEQLVLRPGQTLRFAPGGLHIMLDRLTRPLQAGESVTVMLHTAGGGAVPVAARVRPLTAG